MNHTLSLEQINRTGNLDANLLLHEDKLPLRARFMEIKTINPKMKQKELAKELGFSSSTLQRWRYHIIIQRPYKSNNPKTTATMLNSLKRPQMISKNENEND